MGPRERALLLDAFRDHRGVVTASQHERGLLARIIGSVLARPYGALPFFGAFQKQQAYDPEFVMNDLLTLHIPFRDQTVDVKAEVAEDSVSPHTGRRLRQADTRVPVSADLSADFKEALNDSVAVDDDGNAWSAQLRCESYTQGGSSHDFEIDWIEQEQLQATSVKFQRLALTPSRYEERPDEDDGVITIRFQATLSPAETARLRELEAGDQVYWPVVRVGISDEPRSMRFGQLLWSSREDGSTEYLIMLVDEAHDDRAHKGTAWLRMAGEPRLGNVVTMLADLSGRHEALLDLLEQGTAIDADAKKQIEEAGRRALNETFLFFEVDSVSDWWS